MSVKFSLAKYKYTVAAACLAAVLAFPAPVANAEEAVVTENTGDADEDEYRIDPVDYIIEDDPVESVHDGEPEGTLYLFSSDDELDGTTIPASYDSRDYGCVPSVRNQLGTTLCWCFSTMSGTEINAIKNGLISVSGDLSESQLAYFSLNTQNDKLGNLNDSTTIPSSMDYRYVMGNPSIAAHTLISWKGPVDDTLAPISTALTSDTATAELAYGSDTIHVQNMKCYSTSTDSEDMKAAIMKYGSVQITFYSGSSYNGKSLYNSEYDAQYSPYDVATTHTVSVIGWDDSFSKSKFSVTPDSDGAWLVRDSYGTMHDEGYFWISYCDKSIGPNAFAMITEKTDSYDNIYQYDGTVLDSSVNFGSDSVKVANVFTAKAAGTGTEKLSAVGFYTKQANLQYEINIYTDLQNEADPESGTMSGTAVTGQTDAVGYYTIPLTEEVGLAQDKKFSVVITFSKSGTKVLIPVEGSRTAGDITSEASAGEKESFVYDTTAAAWKDYGTQISSNIRIKAYTDTVADSGGSGDGSGSGDGDSSGGSGDSGSGDEGSSGDKSGDGSGSGGSGDGSSSGGSGSGGSGDGSSSGGSGSGGSGDGSSSGDSGSSGGSGSGDSSSSGDSDSSDDSDTSYKNVTLPFTDVAVNVGNWKYDSIQYVYAKNIMKGTSETAFSPDATLTRGMFATILYRVAGSPAVTFEKKFSDVPVGKWYSDAVTWMAKEGMVNGYSDGTFGVSRPVTRQEMVKMLYGYTQYCGKDVSQTSELTNFTDEADVSSWALKYMKWAVANMVISGSTSGGKFYLKPADYSTRAQAAAVIYRCATGIWK